MEFTNPLRLLRITCSHANWNNTFFCSKNVNKISIKTMHTMIYTRNTYPIWKGKFLNAFTPHPRFGLTYAIVLIENCDKNFCLIYTASLFLRSLIKYHTKRINCLETDQIITRKRLLCILIGNYMKKWLTSLRLDSNLTNRSTIVCSKVSNWDFYMITWIKYYMFLPSFPLLLPDVDKYRELVVSTCA